MRISNSLLLSTQMVAFARTPLHLSRCCEEWAVTMEVTRMQVGFGLAFVAAAAQLWVSYGKKLCEKPFQPQHSTGLYLNIYTNLYRETFWRLQNPEHLFFGFTQGIGCIKKLIYLVFSQHRGISLYSRWQITWIRGVWLSLLNLVEREGE